MRQISVIGSAWGLAEPQHAEAHHFQPVGEQWKSDCGHLTIEPNEWFGGVPILVLWLPDREEEALGLRCGACKASYVSPEDHIAKTLGLPAMKGPRRP